MPIERHQCAVISSPPPEQGGDQQVYVVDMSVAQPPARTRGRGTGVAARSVGLPSSAASAMHSAAVRGNTCRVVWGRLSQRSAGVSWTVMPGGGAQPREAHVEAAADECRLRRLRHGHTPDNASTTHLKPCVSYVTDTPPRTLDTCRLGALNIRPMCPVRVRNRCPFRCLATRARGRGASVLRGRQRVSVSSRLLWQRSR